MVPPTLESRSCPHIHPREGEIRNPSDPPSVICSSPIDKTRKIGHMRIYAGARPSLVMIQSTVVCGKVLLFLSTAFSMPKRADAKMNTTSSTRSVRVIFTSD